MPTSIFDQARSAVSRAVIESLLQAPGAYWDGDEYFTLNPARGDREVGSFSISTSGLWHDFADDTGGDLIDLLVTARGCTKREAAEEIVRVSGGVLPDPHPGRPAKKEQDKPAAMIPAPDKSLKLLNAAASAPWAVERYGKPVKGWTYRTAEGGIAFSVTRHEKLREDGTIAKDVVPWYFGVDNRWHNGQALKDGRPLYNLHELTRLLKIHPDLKILVVEGEKCADVPVDGYLLTTWCAGTGSTTKTDWSPLEQAALEGRVVIWPDADAQNDKTGKRKPWSEQPGQKAALAIARRLPGARILDVRDLADKKDGYDIADAQEEGVDLAAFIEERLRPATRVVEHIPDESEAERQPLLQRIADELRAVAAEAMQREPLAEFPTNESGQAQALARYCGSRLCFTPGRAWGVYDSEEGRWRFDVAEAALFSVLDYLARQRADMRDSADFKAAETFAKAAPTWRSMRAVSELASRLPGIFRLHSEFDCDPDMLNCRGVAINLRTGDSRPSTPGDLFTMTTGYRPESYMPSEFAAFMAQISCGHDDLAAWMMRWFGYSLTGNMDAPFFVNEWGGGRNGKGTLTKLMRKVFGSYAIGVNPSVVIDDGRPSGPRPDVVDLNGPRCGFVDEVPPGKLSIETVKRLTGGDSFRAARKFQDDIEFQPRIKLTLVSNHRVELRRVDVAMVRRFRLVPFLYQIPEGEEDPLIEQRLEEEAPGVLAWLISEARVYLQTPGPRGFPQCKTIDDASKEYVDSEDIYGRFIEERCDRMGSDQASMLYNNFVDWIKGQGIAHPPSQRTFGEALALKGIQKEKQGTIRYKGLTLKGQST